MSTTPGGASLTCSPVAATHAQIFDEVVRSRRSTRSYTEAPVALDLVEELLELAGRAPSNSNVQPWHTYVLSGRHKRELTKSVIAYYDQVGRVAEREFDYQPAVDQWAPPFSTRREHFGDGLYGQALGLQRSDSVDRERYHRRNYDFFNAPVGLIFTVARHPKLSSLIDIGAYIQTFMLAARSRGLATCAQASFIDFHPAIRSELNISADFMIVCGMSLGWEDTAQPIALNRTEREPVESVATFRWDDTEQLPSSGVSGEHQDRPGEPSRYRGGDL